MLLHSPRCTSLDSDPSLKLQHTLTQQISEQRFKALYDRLDPSTQQEDSRLCHGEACWYCAWLKAISTVPELSIPSDKMLVIALRLFLGIPFQKEVKDYPICRKRIDDFNVQHMLLHCNTEQRKPSCNVMMCY